MVVTSSFSSSPSSLSLLAAGCDLAGGAKSEERASERRGERRGSARERESFSFCLPPRPSTSFAAFCVVVAFMQHSFLSARSNTACTGLSRQHRPGRGLLSAFGCYLRNFWRAIALYFLSAQSQAAHCGWFLAVSGCCFPLLPPSSLQPPARKRSLSARLASPGVGAATAGLAPARARPSLRGGGAPWGSRRLSGRCGGGGAGGVVAVQEGRKKTLMLLQGRRSTRTKTRT